MEKENIQISKESVLSAYEQADSDGKGLLENLFGKKLFVPKSAIERIKTFGDACDALGDEHPFVTQYRLSAGAFKGDPQVEDFIAYLKLRIICAALNEGWVPQFTEDEYRYYPWFCLYTQEEIDRMDEDDKAKLLYVGGPANTGAQCGLSYASSIYAFSASHTSLGARLAFKTRELAEYAGTQFIEVWSAFVFKPKAEGEGK